MNRVEVAILVVSVAIIAYYAYSKTIDLKENIEDKLSFF